MRADLDVQMAKANAQSAATWSGTELVCAAMQQGSTLNYVVMTMRLLRAQYPLPHGPACAPDGRGARSRRPQGLKSGGCEGLTA